MLRAESFLFSARPIGALGSNSYYVVVAAKDLDQAYKKIYDAGYYERYENFKCMSPNPHPISKRVLAKGEEL